MMRRLTAALLAAMFAVVSALAAVTPADSVASRRGVPAESLWIPAAAGAGLFAQGAVSAAATRSAPHAIDGAVAGKHSSTLADVGQYVPLAFPWVMKACGAKTRSNWGRMAVSQAFGAVLMNGGVYTSKHLLHRQRPDGTDTRSFPSGHAAWAFMGATAAAIELGQISPWYAVGSYAVAAAVTAQRVISGRHYPVDAVAGAGVGVVATTVGYYLGDLIFGRQADVAPAHWQSACLGLSTGLLWSCANPDFGGNVRLRRFPAMETALRASLPVAPRWSVGIDVALTSTPLDLGETYVGVQNSVGAAAGAIFTLPLSRRVDFNASAAAGYCGNLALKTALVDVGRGSPVGMLNAGVNLRVTSRIGCGVSVGYRMSRYSYTLRPEGIGIAGFDGGVRSSVSAVIGL